MDTLNQRELDKVKTFTLKEFQAELNQLNEWAQHGCRDSGCMIEKKNGWSTNGGCRCLPHNFSEHLLELACKLEVYGRYRPFIKPPSLHPNTD